MSLGGTSAAPAPTASDRPRILNHAQGRLRALPSEVWLTAAAVVGFITITIWWLTQDDRVQDWDNGLHTIEAFTIHDQLAAGHLTAPFTEFNTYPPFGHFVGALGVFLAGKSPASVIIASNLVFVPLLAAGCYGVGRLVYRSRRAGLLAALFALGTPMIVSEFHEFMLDPQQAALVAVSVWAIVASDRLRRTWIALLAGVLAALAMLTKETTEIFLAGLLVVMLLRGGWRNWRGLMAFAIALLAVAGPWYIYHRSELNGLVSLHDSQGGPSGNVAGGFFPERLSRKSFGWYFWDALNIQLLAPFVLAVVIGVVLAVKSSLKDRRPENLLPEMLGGALVSWLGVTLITHKDPRYSLPALVYMAVLGTGWIATAKRWRTGLTVAFVAVVLVNLVGVSTGAGGTVRITLPGAPKPETVLAERSITLYSPNGWVRGGPEHDGDVLALMRGLKRIGVTTVTFDAGSSNDINFNTSGLQVLAIQAGLPTTNVYNPGGLAPREAFMLRHTLEPWDPPPCEKLNDGTGVYVILGYAYIPFANYTFICPWHHPLLYTRTKPLPPGAPLSS
ncbi:MAG TPA: glycosyltransferase family 39 protein [Solirubrobacteraceae bacterium]|nr:glycosyltransferase family 39 protein [Solirubrobacteraceae bacterium]